MNVLNPSLFNSLVRRFGQVKICNEGQPFVVRREPAWKSATGFVEKCVDPGEYYVVCCPKCGDERFRLYVNHRYCTLNGGRLFGRHLIHCFNEDCDHSDFYKIILKPGSYPEMQSTLATEEMAILKETTLPGSCVPLDQLPSNHPAIQYLTAGRKNPAGHPAPSDPVELSQIWGVSYCEQAENHKGYAPEFVTGRIIVPVRWEGKLVGWQARSIVPDVIPKYYTMPGLKKQRILFDGDEARKHREFCVVVEGVFDVFSIGYRCVATLGHKLSWHQRDLLKNWFGNGALCLLYDPDAISDTEMNLTVMKDYFKGGIFSVSLPPRWDPGCMPRDYIWWLIRNQAAAHGIRVPD